MSICKLQSPLQTCCFYYQKANYRIIFIFFNTKNLFAFVDFLGDNSGKSHSGNKYLDFPRKLFLSLQASVLSIFIHSPKEKKFGIRVSGTGFF